MTRISITKVTMPPLTTTITMTCCHSDNNINDNNTAIFLFVITNTIIVTTLTITTATIPTMIRTAMT